MQKVFFTTLLMCLSWVTLAQTPSLTTRQVMDFEVGDQFHYRFKSETPGGNTYKAIRKSILGKQWNMDSSTVSYTIESLTYATNFVNGPWTSMQKDTAVITYSDLNAICYQFFPATNAVILANQCMDDYFDNPNFYEYLDILWYKKVLTGSSGSTYTLKYGQGLGLVSQVAQQMACSEWTDLVYAQKGGITWGTADSTLLTAPPIHTVRFLTNREVYDFEVGDVFQFETRKFDVGQQSRVIVEQKVLNRWDNTNTIEYEIWERDSLLYLIGNPVPTNSKGTAKMLTFDKLDIPVINNNQQYALDGYIDSCNQVYYNHYFYQSSTYELSQYYYEGLGGYTSTKGFSFPATSGFENKLVYFYKSQQNSSCGTYFEFDKKPPIDTTDKNQHFFFSPSEDAFHLQLGKLPEDATLAVYDLTGKQLMKQTAIKKNELYLLSTQDMAQGIYLVCLSKGKEAAWYKIWVY